MNYSFIKPNPKPLISMFSKIWILFILLISTLLVAFGLFLLYKINFYKKEVNIQNSKRVVLEHRVNDANSRIKRLLQQKSLGEEIYSRNTLLKNSIKNLFDLVPDQITLSRVLIDKSSLIIYGNTPTKDIYNFLLAAPLKSIFSTNNTMFYLTKKGWYNFVSTNKITQMDGFSE